MVRRRISNVFMNASDSDVARALGVSRGAIWAYKTGRDCMSQDTLLRVQQVAQLTESEFVELMFDVLLEGNPPDANFLRKAKKRIGRVLKRAQRGAASILLVGLGLMTVPRESVASVFDVELVWKSQTNILYIMRNWRRRWIKVRAWLKSRGAVPLLTRWATERSTAIRPSAWPRSPAPI
jgi:plasmid maintenance system antidote protein VapI